MFYVYNAASGVERGSHMAADIRKSLAAQKALAQMDRTQFQIFAPGECLSH